MPSKYEGFEGKLNEFNARYQINFSFAQHERQDLSEDGVNPALLTEMDELSRENLAYRNSALNCYTRCVENMIEGKYETFDVDAFFHEFEAVMDDYRAYRTSKQKDAPAPLGGWAVDRDAYRTMTTALDSVSQDRSLYGVKQYQRGDITYSQMRSDLNAIGQKKEEELSDDDIFKMSLYGAAMDHVRESRTWRDFINPLKWIPMIREYIISKQALDLSNKFLSVSLRADSAVSDKSYLDRAKKANQKANSASYSRELAANKEQRRMQMQKDQEHSKENGQPNEMIEQQDPKVNVQVNANDDVRQNIVIEGMDEMNQNREIVPSIREDESISKSHSKDLV